MTVIADSKKRVVLRPVMSVRSRRARVRFKKHGRFTIVVTDGPIYAAALKEDSSS